MKHGYVFFICRVGLTPGVSPQRIAFPSELVEVGGLGGEVGEGIEVTSVINILHGGREVGVSLSNLPSLHLH